MGQFSPSPPPPPNSRNVSLARCAAFRGRGGGSDKGRGRGAPTSSLLFTRACRALSSITPRPPPPGSRARRDTPCPPYLLFPTRDRRRRRRDSTKRAGVVGAPPDPHSLVRRRTERIVRARAHLRQCGGAFACGSVLFWINVQARSVVPRVVIPI